LLRFASRCGATVPDWLRARFDGLDDDPDTRRMIAANVAIEQVQRLRQQGVEEFHFYTLNRVMGKMPGTMLALMPAAAQRSRYLKKKSVSKKN
jgi:methylenetetrahydrofolate reductase (NADPH)